MAFITDYAELEELGGGRVRQTISIARIAYPWQGSRRRITDIIGNTGDPNLPLGVDELVQFRVRDRLAGNSPLAHFGKGRSHIKWTWLGTNNVNGQPSGNTQLFTGAWTGADLRMAIAGHILHDDAPLKTGHPSVFSLRLDAHQNFNLDTLSSDEFRILDPILISPSGLDNIPLSWVKSVQGGKLVLTVTLPPGDFAGWTLDPTITLQPDGTAGMDAYLSAANPNTNYNDAVLGIGEPIGSTGDNYRSPIKFDQSSLPSAAIISSAVLSVWLSQAGNAIASNNRTGRVYRLKRAWVETQVTWNSYSTGNPWQTAGGFGALDCEQTDIGTCAFATTDANGSQHDFALTPTTKAGLDLGNGWLLKVDTETNDLYQLHSSDSATPANRPKLVVTYTVPPAGVFVPLWVMGFRGM